MFRAWAVRFEAFLRRHAAWTLAFLAVVAAAEGVRLVRRDKLGDFNAVHQAAARLVEGDALYATRGGRSYPYSPAFAFAVLPLGLLPLGAAKAVWYAVGVVSIALSCRLAARILWPGGPAPCGFYVLALVGSLAFGHNALQHGQATPLMLMLSLLSWHQDGRGRPWVAGACLAAAVIIKPFPVLFVLLYATRRRWRTALAVALSAGALLAAPAVAFGDGYADVLRGWYDVVRQQQTIHDITGHTNQSVTAFWNRALGVEDPPTLPLEPTPASALIVLTSLAFLGVATWAGVRATDRAGATVAFALFMICWAALPPYGWKHYYVTMLAPCAVLAWIILEDAEWARGAERALMLCVLAIVAIHIPTPFAPHLMHDASTVFLMGAAVFAFLAAYAMRRRRAEPPVSPP